MTKVFKIAYCDLFVKSKESTCKEICKQCVEKIYSIYPEFGRKVKIHLLLHLTDCMIQFGPTQGFNTERLVCTLLYISYNCILSRFEAFNSLIRSKNIFANRLSPSRDIATRFEVTGHLRSICNGAVLDDKRYLSLAICKW